MYIWLGISVEDELTKISKKASAIEKVIGFDNSNFTLPLHISIKMSFLINDELFDEISNDVAIIVNKYHQFEVKPKMIECLETIIWIIMEKNPILNEIHNEILRMLKNKYQIIPHEYDLDYMFHTTLFMDRNQENINKAYQMIKGTILPDTLKITKFLIGNSKTGELGTYKVVKEISLL